MRAGALAEAGRLDEASDALDGLVADIAHRRGRVAGLAPMAIRYLPEVCRRLDETADATTLLEHVTSWSGQLLLSAWGLSIDGAADPALGHLLATLGRLDEADAAYTSGAELERAADFAPLVARTEFWHARALFERGGPGDRDRTQTLLDESIRIAQRHRMLRLLRDATSSSHARDDGE